MEKQPVEVFLQLCMSDTKFEEVMLTTPKLIKQIPEATGDDVKQLCIKIFENFISSYIETLRLAEEANMIFDDDAQLTDDLIMALRNLSDFIFTSDSDKLDKGTSFINHYWRSISSSDQHSYSDVFEKRMNDMIDTDIFIHIKNQLDESTWNRMKTILHYLANIVDVVSSDPSEHRIKKAYFNLLNDLINEEQFLIFFSFFIYCQQLNEKHPFSLLNCWIHNTSYLLDSFGVRFF